MGGEGGWGGGGGYRREVGKAVAALSFWGDMGEPSPVLYLIEEGGAIPKGGK